MLAFLLCYFFEISHATEYITSSSPAITSNWYPNGDVIVQAGGKLDIRTGVTVYMDPGAKIQVESNGRMKAQYATITVDGTGFWAGIEILGVATNPNQPSANDAINMTVATSPADQKGAAYLSNCTIERCNFGTVVGEFQLAGNVQLHETSSKGGGTLVAEWCTYRYIKHIGICFAPFTRKVGTTLWNNNSSLTSVTIFDDYNTKFFFGVGLFKVSLSNNSLYNVYIENRVPGSTPDLGNIAFGRWGFYTVEAAFTLNNSYISGFWNGVEMNDITNAKSKRILNTNFYNNLFDIVGNNSYHLTVDHCASTKNMGGVDHPSKFISVNGGDDYYFNNNYQVGFTNPSTSFRTLGTGGSAAIFFSGGQTNTGKLTRKNNISNYTYGSLSQDPNRGMKFECNQYTSTKYDVSILSGGVADQGSKTKAAYNTFHSGCTGTTHWYQNPGTIPTKYWYKISGMPSCTSSYLSLSLSNNASVCATYVPSAPYRLELKNQLANEKSVLASLPSSMSSMTADQLSDFHDARLYRDFYLSGLIQDYIDSAQYDSAFYVLDENPCLRASLDEMNLNLTLGNFSGLTSLINQISSDFADTTTGYKDSTLSAQALDYYPIIIDLTENKFSDSILDVYHSDLLALAGVESYYGSVAQNILQLHYDSLFRVYIPRDSTYADSVLYPVDSLDHIYDPEAPMTEVIDYSNFTGGISIYPNPVLSELTVSMPENLAGKEGFMYKIYSIIGHQMMQGALLSTATTLDVSDLSPGLYIIEVNSAGSVSRFQFFKK